MKKKDDLIAAERVKAIQEQLCGFPLDEFINHEVEFYDDGKTYCPENAVWEDDQEF